MSTYQKSILVTGSSNGIGRLTVETLVRQGHRVYATMRDVNGKNAAAKDELSNLARKENLSLKVVELDVTDQQSVDSAVSEITSETGGIDVVVNNAGVMFVGISEAFSFEQIQQQFDTNFFGVERVTRAVLPEMRQAKNGLIINVSSLAGRAVFPFFGVYCASKWALEAMTEAYRYELSQFGIELILVEPGPFPSGLIDSTPENIDSQISAEYGEIAEIPKNLITNFVDLYNSENAPRTQDVADSIAKLIALPKSERPFRTIVGMDFGLKKLNEVTAPIQDSLIQALGLDYLTKLRFDVLESDTVD